MGSFWKLQGPELLFPSQMKLLRLSIWTLLQESEEWCNSWVLQCQILQLLFSPKGAELAVWVHIWQIIFCRLFHHGTKKMWGAHMVGGLCNRQHTLWLQGSAFTSKLTLLDQTTDMMSPWHSGMDVLLQLLERGKHCRCQQLHSNWLTLRNAVTQNTKKNNSALCNVFIGGYFEILHCYCWVHLTL